MEKIYIYLWSLGPKQLGWSDAFLSFQTVGDFQEFIYLWNDNVGDFQYFNYCIFSNVGDNKESVCRWFSIVGDKMVSLH